MTNVRVLGSMKAYTFCQFPKEAVRADFPLSELYPLYL